MESLLCSQGSSSPRPQVLIVDDQDSLRKALCGILESAGYDVLGAGSGPEALALWRESSRPIDLLVTDYNMPDMTGLELARECTGLDSELRVLYISGSNPDQELRADLEANKRVFLAKPFRVVELLRTAKQLIEPTESWSGAERAGRQQASA